MSERGDALVQEAIKVRDSWSLFNKKGKTRDAGDLFTKAANAYKVEKNWLKAAEAFIQAADCFMKVGDIHDYCRAYNDAANCYKKVSIKDAVECFLKCSNIYVEEGRFSSAAKTEKDIAELYESEHDYENAMKHYQKAADYYDGDGSVSTANGMLLKVAHLAALAEDYFKAAEIYEKVAKDSVGNKLTKYSVRGYLLNAALCKLALGDVVDAKKSLDEYSLLSFEFSQSREFNFLSDIVDAVDNYDIDKFTKVVQEYNSISRLDPWHTKVLLKIKDSIKDEDDYS